MSKQWWKAALIRAVRTFAQGLVTLIGSEAINIIDLNWPHMLGMAATMALVSLLTSIGGLPEVSED